MNENPVSQLSTISESISYLLFHVANNGCVVETISGEQLENVCFTLKRETISDWFSLGITKEKSPLILVPANDRLAWFVEMQWQVIVAYSGCLTFHAVDVEIDGRCLFGPIIQFPVHAKLIDWLCQHQRIGLGIINGKKALPIQHVSLTRAS